ncbi:Transcriptional regulator of nonfermentable carbon utilization [Mycoblastus sanguinarius]|nr:Transcriptional regulator of nonfermentable carbon utilization [Mycoblastus sanguinarius]
MATERDEDDSSRSHSDSSSDSESQNSDDMSRVGNSKDTVGIQRKTSTGKIKKPAEKDPNRVKRKKARRACENCQRAHLTCGDERPCARCGDKKPCRDGKRKKAKYLKDTPDEALTPGQDQRTGLEPSYSSHFPGGPFPRNFPGPGPGGVFAGHQAGSLGYPMMYPSDGRNQIPIPSASTMMTTQPGNAQQLAMAQPLNLGSNSQPSSIPDYSRALQQNAQMAPSAMQDPFLSASDLFPNFEMDSSFDNKYAAAEYGILGHMSSGMVDTPPSENMGTFNPSDDASYVPGMLSTGYSSSPATTQPYHYPQGQAIGEWTSDSQGASGADPNAYNFDGQNQDHLDVVKQESLAVGSSTYPSPSSGPSPQGMMAGFDDSPAARSIHTNMNQSNQAYGPREAPSHQRFGPSGTSILTSTAASAPPFLAQTLSSRRTRNPSTVYDRVTQPYSYTKAFHDLMALIRKRFSPQKTARIAKALASIRPSFISSLTKLDDHDRVFMEKCLQRTLLEYEDFLSLTGTPTILCRRTGEVVAVGEGFSILTGWRRTVLLGKEANLNVNKGGDASGPPGTGTSTSRGTNTPRIPDSSKSDALDDNRLKPVSIVDLFDDESACEFFDDYAHLAFGDSRGKAIRSCKLLKYKTAKDAGFDKNLDSEVGSRLKQQRDTNWNGRDSTGNQLGGENGKVECMLCWSVKRDVFDIPMLFVMNVLPYI